MARNRMYRVVIPEHVVRWARPPREYPVPGGTWELGAPDAMTARVRCSGWACADAGVPPLRSLIRQTVRASSAVEFEHAQGSKEAKMIAQQRERDKVAGR